MILGIFRCPSWRVLVPAREPSTNTKATQGHGVNPHAFPDVGAQTRLSSKHMIPRRRPWQVDARVGVAV